MARPKPKRRILGRVLDQREDDLRQRARINAQSGQFTFNLDLHLMRGRAQRGAGQRSNNAKATMVGLSA